VQAKWPVVGPVVQAPGEQSQQIVATQPLAGRPTR